MPQLVVQALPEPARGAPAPLPTGQRRGVYPEAHAHRGLFHLDGGQRHRVLGVGQGLADGRLLQPGNGHDVARLGRRHVHPLQPVVHVQVAGAFRELPAVTRQADDGLPGADPAGGHPAHGRQAPIVVIIQRGDQDLQWRVGIHDGARDLAQDGVEQGLQVRAELGRQACLARRRHGIDDRKVGLLVGGPQLDKEVKGLVEGPVEVRVLAVQLVDDHDGAMAHLQSLPQHESRLRHGAFGGVHQEQDAVHHVQDPFHLAAKVGVARRVHDIDLDLLVALGIMDADGRVLGQDGDAALPFQVVRVQHALGHLLVAAKDVGLLEQAVHERCFAMVYVRDDGNIAHVCSFDEHSYDIPSTGQRSFPCVPQGSTV